VSHAKEEWSPTYFKDWCEITPQGSTHLGHKLSKTTTFKGNGKIMKKQIPLW